MSELETIVAAAIRQDDVVLFSAPPARHHNLIRYASRVVRPDEQGFLTSTLRFVGRFEAYDIASLAGQIIRKTGPDGELFSEDLW